MATHEVFSWVKFFPINFESPRLSSDFPGISKFPDYSQLSWFPRKMGALWYCPRDWLIRATMKNLYFLRFITFIEYYFNSTKITNPPSRVLNSICSLKSDHPSLFFALICRWYLELGFKFSKSKCSIGWFASSGRLTFVQRLLTTSVSLSSLGFTWEIDKRNKYVTLVPAI